MGFGFRVPGVSYYDRVIRLMDKILHDPKDPKLWELRYIPYYGSCRILSINRKDPRLCGSISGAESPRSDPSCASGGVSPRV